MDNEFDIELTLSFKGLTMNEVRMLEKYVYEGLHGREWGPPHMVIRATFVGARVADKDKKIVSKEELLALEKKGASKGK